MRWKSIIMPKEIRQDEQVSSDTYGKFYIEPLERGYGTTFGNSLRRILLSSIQGAAVTSARFGGVTHQFTTLPGVFEDLTDIILNLKTIRLRLLGDPPKTLLLEAQKKGEYKASDLKRDAEVEIMNPDQHILTLTEEGEVSVELSVNAGRGYVSAEQNKTAEAPVGTIFLDSFFSPVTKVNYEVENTRVGQRTDYDRLIMEIWTDGTITPGEALKQGAKIMKDHLGVFVQSEEELPVLEEEKVDDDILRVRNLLRTRIDELELSVRSSNCLKAAKIETLEELVRRSEAEMLRFRNFGRKSLNELSAILQNIGLSWGMDVEKFKEKPKAAVVK
jgi:DNA-directed RNA polymerase subunit alpha